MLMVTDEGKCSIKVLRPEDAEEKDSDTGRTVSSTVETLAVPLP